MKTTLLFNPASGIRRERRLQAVREAASILKSNGFDVEIEETRTKGSGAEQAREALRHGSQTIFACGGDGTVHDVLQGMVGSKAALGILPAGSANALARELGIPKNLLRAAARFRPEHSTQTRVTAMRQVGLPDTYFLARAGAGPDGALMYRMMTSDRSRWSHWLYYLQALRVFLHADFPAFEVTYQTRDSDVSVRMSAVSAMVLRVGKLGGLFASLARGASLKSDALRMILVHPPAQLSLPLWFVTSWLHLPRRNPLLTVLDVDNMSVFSEKRVDLQADGEWIGRAPVDIRWSEHGIRLLIPTNQYHSAKHGTKRLRDQSGQSGQSSD